MKNEPEYGADPGYTLVADAIAQTIAAYPTADVEPIIRCKSCLHKVTTNGEYNPEDIVCDYWNTDGLQENDFCAYGAEGNYSEDEFCDSNDNEAVLAFNQYQKYGAIIPCGSCRHFRQIPDTDYGTCLRALRNGGSVMKTTDYCSYAELPLPEADDHTVSGLLEE